MASVSKSGLCTLDVEVIYKASLQVINPRSSSRLSQKYTVFKFKAQGQVLAVFSARLYCGKDVKCFFSTPLICPIKEGVAIAFLLPSSVSGCTPRLLYETGRKQGAWNRHRLPLRTPGWGNQSKEPKVIFPR